MTRRLTRLGTNFRNIGVIFITHPHSDHTSGLGALMSIVYDANRISPVDIYGPPGTVASVNGLLEFLNVNSDIKSATEPRPSPRARCSTLTIPEPE